MEGVAERVEVAGTLVDGAEGSDVGVAGLSAGFVAGGEESGGAGTGGTGSKTEAGGVGFDDYVRGWFEGWDEAVDLGSDFYWKVC